METHKMAESVQLRLLPGLGLAGNTSGVIQFEGDSNVGNEGSSGIFEAVGNVGNNLAAIAGVSVTEAQGGNPGFGDAYFEVLSSQWSTSGDVRIVIGQWSKNAFLANRRERYSRNLPFRVALYAAPQ
jgi:hypothetical protein